MKKRYFLTRSGARGTSGIRGGRSVPGAVLLTGAGLCVIAALFLLLRVLAPGALAFITAPLWGAGAHLSASVESGSHGLQNAAALAQERDALVQSNQRLIEENAVLTARITDLEHLAGSASSTVLSIPGSIVAGVLARPPEAPYDTLVLALPNGTSVKSGDVVLAQGGVPVGSIASSARGIAHVRLYSSSAVESAGWLGALRTPVTLVGRGAGSYFASIPGTEQASVGDMVYLPGPGALPVGTIARVDKDPSSPTVTLQIRPLVNPFTLTEVLIVSKS